MNSLKEACDEANHFTPIFLIMNSCKNNSIHKFYRDKCPFNDC